MQFRSKESSGKAIEVLINTSNLGKKKRNQCKSSLEAYHLGCFVQTIRSCPCS